LIRMRTFARRPLSRGEVALAQPVFGAEIAWPRVRIVQAPAAGFGAMAPLRHTIIFSGWKAAADFAIAPLAEQGWFIHELAHIWQAGQGVSLPLAKLSALGRQAYRLRLTPGKTFWAYNIEQQAEIVRGLFLARAADRPDPDLERLWAARGGASAIV
jgi:hypothetical protein